VTTTKPRKPSPPARRKPAQVHTRTRNRERKRKDVATLKGKAAFLKQFAVSGNVLQAAQKAGVGRRTVYTWLESDAQFKGLYDEAYEDALDALEEEARRRAVDGVSSRSTRAARRSARSGSTRTRC
jgi:hypothetical protein